MTVFGMLRVKNETRWVVETIKRMLYICERVFVFDDGSTDGTPEFCEQIGEQVTVIRSPFREPIDQGLDETRDKTYLLQRIMGCVSDIHLRGNPYSPFWALCLDGDEWLEPSTVPVMRETLKQTSHHAFSLPIKFLWESDLSQVNTPGCRRIRVDGVYRRFADIGRPSLFRLFNAAFKFQSTPWGKKSGEASAQGANFHCSSIPQELLGHAHLALPVTLWHLGYNDKADRLRKYEWYNRIDPNNPAEDCYRHMVQGDIPEIHPEARLLHAGPFRVEMV
jgi:glycosyltransferase involved in cell wall biosynthesis